MSVLKVHLLLAAFGLALVQPAQAQEVSPDQVVGALEGTFGVNPGQRRNHIKGTCATGEFVGTTDAAAISRSALFSGEKIPVVARFSLPSGNPKLPDAARTVRGMALQFTLPRNDVHNMAMLNAPMFGVASPQAFFEQVVAGKPDPATGKPDPEKLKAFREKYPETRGLADYMAANNPPASYASSAFYSIHTFKFIDAAKKVTLVRWRFVPQGGEVRLTEEEMKTLPGDFLEERLIAATKSGPVRWDMIVTIGEAGDPETDPTKVWPAGRREIKAGTLTITAAMPQKGAACEAINFDPLAMAAGIDATDDPVLQFRSPAYAVSYSKRFEGK